MYQSSQSNYRWIFSITKGYRSSMFVFFTLELVSILTTLLFILYSKKCIDIAMHSSSADLRHTLLLVIIFAVAGVIVKSISQYINQKTQVDMLLNFQFDIMRKQMLAVWQNIRRWDTGDLLVRLNSDCSEIIQMISSTWMTFLITGIKILSSFILLFTMDRMLAVVILCVSPLFLLTKLYYKKMKALNRNVKDLESEIGSTMQENFRFRIILKSLGAIPNRLTVVKWMQQRYAKLRLDYLNFSLFTQSSMRLTMSVGYLLAFCWGIYRLSRAEITYGTMAAFLQLVNQIQTPILTLGAFIPAFVRFKVSADRVREIDNLEQDSLENSVILDDIFAIEFNNVSFGYESVNVVENFTAKFEKNTFTSIAGTSGKGKTTLIRLLLGLIKPNSGSIIIKDVRHCHDLTSDFIDNFSYVPQGNTLFKGTIRENITLGDEKVTEEELADLLHVSCAEFVYDLPDGIDTNVSESGLGLSEGQAQRIAIARALLKKCAVILFDEATSALDEKTTNLFLNRLKTVIGNKIVIFVTHDNLVLNASQNVIVMN